VSYWGWPDVWPSWTWPGRDGEPLRVDVYSACESVELLLDGASLGTKRPERCIATFEIPYRPGTLRAVGSDPAAACELRTAGEPTRLRLTPDRDAIRVDDLSFVTVEVVDEGDCVVPNANHAISFAVDGDGALAAVGNGDPQSTERYRGNRCRAHRGRCLVVIKSRDDSGELRLRAEADGIAAGETAVRVGAGEMVALP
jgi:beta-galactosidase